MKISVKETHDSYILALKGELDASSSLLLDEEVAKAMKVGKPFLLIDCQELQYISSTGLGVFISNMQDLRRRNMKLVLYQVSPKIKDVFTILGLEPFLTFADCSVSAYNACLIEN